MWLLTYLCYPLQSKHYIMKVSSNYAKFKFTFLYDYLCNYAIAIVTMSLLLYVTMYCMSRCVYVCVVHTDKHTDLLHTAYTPMARGSRLTGITSCCEGVSLGTLSAPLALSCMQVSSIYRRLNFCKVVNVVRTASVSLYNAVWI